MEIRCNYGPYKRGQVVEIRDECIDGYLTCGGYWIPNWVFESDEEYKMRFKK